MNFLKRLIETIAGLMVLVGFFLLIGTAGASDLADETGQMFSYKDYIPSIISGFVLIFVGGGIMKWFDKNFYYEEGGESNARKGG